ncbi:hypothetical protein GQ44DRAFT_753038 [Phaeosphaeriaceae sp. PMI808]|nr:hypothetical protein GQ44DRAFT_753038 [Phaeosphaeriaceae sp. PMI808]
MVRFGISTAVVLIGFIPGTQLVNAEFTIYDNSTLLDATLGDECRAALTASINCVPYVQTFQQLSYRGDLDVALTDSICTQDCLSSLKAWFDTVSAKCVGKSVSEGIPTRYGGYIWAGYNETCIKDPRPPRAYCNIYIQRHAIQDMPRTELCHTCNSSQYSIYDEYYKEQLDYIYAQCKLAGPTAVLNPLDIVQPMLPSYCLSNKRYTTKQGDTCESISSGTSVSSAALYMGNQDLLKDCASINPGLSVCLPLTCITYNLQPSDTCYNIERKLGLEAGIVQQFNSWLNMGCTNLHSATAFYGKYICVSPQGGEFKNPDKPPVSNPTLGTADGYTREKVAPPEGAKVAEGTTLQCGKWHVVAAGDACVKICLTNGIDTNLFHEVNPSLAPGADCDASLKEQTALCAGPTYNWKTVTLGSSSSATGVSSSVPRSSTT